MFSTFYYYFALFQITGRFCQRPVSELHYHLLMSLIVITKEEDLSVCEFDTLSCKYDISLNYANVNPGLTFGHSITFIFLVHTWKK